MARRPGRVTTPDPDERDLPIEYPSNAAGTIRWIRDYLGVELTEPQKEIVYAFHRHQKLLIVAGNGFGKTFVLACLTMAFLFLNVPDVSIMATSGTFGKMRRTYCQPIKQFHQNTWGLPGEYLKSDPRIRFDDEPECFWEADTPRDAGELEGVHNKYTLGIVEEADKKAVGADIFDALGSLITDSNDKLVAVANPPKEETDVVYDLMDDDAWEVKQFSSFDSHNVMIELNHDDPYQRDEDGELLAHSDGWPKLKPEVEEQMVDGIVRLNQIRRDWEAWNNEPWPGVESARRSGERDDLDVRWYRRRLGVVSPKASHVPRPFVITDVEDAYNREPAATRVTPNGLGFDVSRGHGDYNALVGVFGREIRVIDYWHAEDDVENEEKLRSVLNDSWKCPMAVDAVGIGSGIADRINTWYPNSVRFHAGGVAHDEEAFGNRWTEGLCVLGDVLNDGAGFTDNRLREEMMTAARVIQLDEKYSKKYDSDRYEATSKGAIKDRLGRSPDILDATYMAVLMGETGGSDRRTISSTW